MEGPGIPFAGDERLCKNMSTEKVKLSIAEF